jgi:excisionase family DNA binding protein
MAARFVTVPQVAAALGMSVPTIHRAIRHGEIPALRVGRTVRVSRRWLEQKLADFDESFADPPLRTPSDAIPTASEGNF